MKKYFLLFLILLLGFFFNKAKAQDDVTCPDGWARQEAVITLDCPPMPNCKLKVIYCCFWDEIHLTLNIRIKRIDFLGNGMPFSNWACYYVCYYYNSQQFWTDISRAIRGVALETTCVPFIVDCSDSPLVVVKEYRSQCWYYENFWFTKYEDQWLFVMRPCDEGDLSCIHEYKICKNGSDIVVLEEKWTMTGPPNCSTNEPTELPPPGKTWEEYWRTDCFAKPCLPQ